MAWYNLSQDLEDVFADAAGYGTRRQEMPAEMRGSCRITQLVVNPIQRTKRVHGCAVCTRPITGRRETCSAACHSQLRKTIDRKPITREQFVPLAALGNKKIGKILGIHHHTARRLRLEFMNNETVVIELYSVDKPVKEISRRTGIPVEEVVAVLKRLGLPEVKRVPV